MQAQPLNETELKTIERAHPEGLTSAQIVQIFSTRGFRLSEATFRKYVQLGLVPRSRRVGTKGKKHRGSRGMYPSAAVRRINTIKQLLADDFTIEEIQRNFQQYKQRIDAVQEALAELFKGFEREMAQPTFELATRRRLHSDVSSARRTATTLFQQLGRIESVVTAPPVSRDDDKLPS